jgi:hypothetical protein
MNKTVDLVHNAWTRADSRSIVEFGLGAAMKDIGSPELGLSSDVARRR